MPENKLTWRVVLGLSAAFLLYETHGLLLITGLYLTVSYVGTVILAPQAAAAAWPVILAGSSLLLLGAALWLRKRREDKAIAELIRQAKERRSAG